MRALAVAYALALVMLAAMFPFAGQAQPAGPAEPHLFDDALVAPPPQRAFTVAAGDGRGPSQFMAGDVAVLVVLPESDGTIDPSLENWTAADIAAVRERVREAGEWWAQRLPLARLRFHYRFEVVPTSYEPTSRRAAEEGLWVGETLGRLGYQGSSYFDRAYAAADSVRAELGADWGTVLFVPNSANGNGYLADGRFAYAYINGPFLVVTSDAGSYGGGDFAAVLAHELGHTFGALDQYGAARIACDRRSGYLFTPTTNSQHAGCGGTLPSIMLDAVGAYRGGHVDPSARHQIGYRDSDGDGVIDPLDTVPELDLGEPSLASSSGRPVIKGSARDVGYPSAVQQHVSLNTVRAVEYRIDGGPWIPVRANDGSFDEPQELFSAELPLYDGVYTVELRATNSAGATSEPVVSQLNITWIGPAPRYSVSAQPALASPEVALSIVAPAGTAAVQTSERVDFADAPWRPFAPDLRHQLPPGDGARTLYVRFRDLFGLESLPIVLATVVDTQPPTGSAVRPAGSPTQLLLDAVDATTAVTAVEVRVGDAPPAWIEYAPTVELSAAGPDERVSVRFRDAAGNLSPEIVALSGYRVALPLVRR